MLLRDGEVIAAAEEERLPAKSTITTFPAKRSSSASPRGIRGQDLDYVAFFEKPFVKFERILFSTLQTFPRSRRVFQESMVSWMSEKLWIKTLIKDNLGVVEEKILFGDHHLSHAASGFSARLSMRRPYLRWTEWVSGRQRPTA